MFRNGKERFIKKVLGAVYLETFRNVLKRNGLNTFVQERLGTFSSGSVRNVLIGTVLERFEILDQERLIKFLWNSFYVLFKNA